MIKRVAIFCLLCMVLLSTFVLADLNTDIVAYWDFEEGTGDFIDKVDGNNNIINHGTNYLSEGLVGFAADFESEQGDYGAIADHPDLRDSSITISSWVNLEALPVAPLGAIFAKGHPDSVGSYSLWIKNNGGVECISKEDINWVGGSHIIGESTSGVISADKEWHHVVGVFDTYLKNCKVYHNGELVAESQTAPQAYNLIDQEEAQIGGSIGTGYFLNGRVDELGIWKRALNSTEVGFLYNGGLGTNPLYDADGDGFSEFYDCNDTNPNINPNATEVCDRMDNDCDGYIDEFLLCDEDMNQRISFLETWAIAIGGWKETTMTTISDILSDISELFAITDNHESRVETLENQTSYWKYLDEATRKDIVCNIAIESNLTSITNEDLGLECTVSYGNKIKCNCNTL